MGHREEFHKKSEQALQQCKKFLDIYSEATTTAKAKGIEEVVKALAELIATKTPDSAFMFQAPDASGQPLYILLTGEGEVRQFVSPYRPELPTTFEKLVLEKGLDPVRFVVLVQPLLDQLHMGSMGFTQALGSA